ncbi:MAG TPA: peroxide stress protein YaaA [Lentimicrobium sp.]|nr:peroxide stress protein YaaA [Lentimicrobium sp.]
MLILLSPSKTLDFETPVKMKYGSEPALIKQSVQLVRIMKKIPVTGFMEMMGISRKLAELNHERYQRWYFPYDKKIARPAFAAFMGDVYEGLKAWELDSTQIEFADQHVRILSGLYGLLKPTDLILPYRLEMGIKIKGKVFDDLYEFWSDKITRKVITDLKTSNKVLVNLASAEYAKAVNFEKIKATIITPFFVEFRNGQYKFITLSGKKARGTMARYIIDKKLTDPQEIKLFDYDGYSFDEKQSNDERWIFTR